MNRTFDRLPEFDERSREYPIRALVGDTRQPRYKLWGGGRVLDQGTEGACVGFGWAHELAATPIRVKGATENEFARTIYKEAQKVDQWPGEDYDGTSVLAGAKVVKSMGKISEYRWCFSLEDVLLALSYEGPVVLGLNWYEGMFDTDSKGYIYPTGRLLGGHCIMARGVSVHYERVALRNSWGPDWGKYGGCYLKFEDLERLLHEQGEA